MLGSEPILSRFDRMKHPLALLIVIGLVIRLIIAPLFTFNIDLGYWAEVVDVFQNGFGLYGTQGYYYTPIWGYYLGAVSGFMECIGMTDYGAYVQDMEHLLNYDFRINAFVTSVGFNFLVKLPLIIVDTVVAWLIYEFILKRTADRRKALLGFSLWFFSALVITETAFHGTFDNMSVMFFIISVMLMFDRKYFLSGMAFATASLTKFFPLFFVFFMIAYILRKEGVDRNGSKQLGIAVLGAFVASVIIFIPNIIRGDFWLSLDFITGRIGISKEMLASITPLTSAVIFIAIAAVILLVLYVIAKWGPKFMEWINRHDEAYRNKKCAKILAVIAAVVIAILMVFFYITLSRSFSLEGLGFRCVVLISVFSIFLEIYLAFRLLMLKDIDNEKKVATLLFLSALAVIMWTPSPSYVILIVPFVCIYAAMVDHDYVRPCIVFTLLFTVAEIQYFITCPTSLVYALTGSVAPFIPIYEFLVQPCVFGLSGFWTINIIPMLAAYVAMIYISYKFYMGRRKEGTLWIS